MASALDLARQLLALADRDLKVFRKLADDPEIEDASVGFLAQQVLEKCLKSALARHALAFRRTHDLGELVDGLSDAGKALPPYADRLDELNPYAVEFRYGLVNPRGLDRTWIKSVVEAVRAWAAEQLH